MAPWKMSTLAMDFRCVLAYSAKAAIEADQLIAFLEMQSEFSSGLLLTYTTRDCRFDYMSSWGKTAGKLVQVRLGLFAMFT